MLITISNGTQKKMDLLGIGAYPFSEDILKSCYRERAKLFHPDVNKQEGAEAMFRKIQESYEALKNLAVCVTEEERQLELSKQQRDKEDMFAVYDTCKHCSGTGKLKRRMPLYSPRAFILCPTCSSKCKKCEDGVFTLKSGRKVTCRECDGTGIVRRNTRRCSTCWGAGKVYDFKYEEYLISCDYCSGTGKIKLELFNPVIPPGAIL